MRECAPKQKDTKDWGWCEGMGFTIILFGMGRLKIAESHVWHCRLWNDTTRIKPVLRKQVTTLIKSKVDYFIPYPRPHSSTSKAHFSRGVTRGTDKTPVIDSWRGLMNSWADGAMRHLVNHLPNSTLIKLPVAATVIDNDKGTITGGNLEGSAKLLLYQVIFRV